MEHDRTNPSHASRCLQKYERLIGELAPGAALDLARFTDEELTGFYLSAFLRFVDGVKLTTREAVAVIELIGDGDGEGEWRRLLSAVIAAEGPRISQLRKTAFARRQRKSGAA